MTAVQNSLSVIKGRSVYPVVGGRLRQSTVLQMSASVQYDVWKHFL